MMTANLLIELFVEELPPKALKKLGDAFASVLFDQLKAQGLASDESKLTAFASPRRLAAHVTSVAARGADKAISQKLMPVSVALDAAGNATPALLKKLQAFGADASAVGGLKRAMDGKAEALRCVLDHAKGRPVVWEALLAIDRENGTVMGISFWETEADMRAGEQLGREARRRAGEAGGTRGEPVVDRWEVVFDEMV